MGFSTSSLYQAIAATRGSEELSQIWEIKLSLKIHIFCVHNLFMVGFLLGWRSASRTALEMGSVLCVVWMRTLIRYYFLVSRLNFYGVAFGQWLAAGDALQTFLTSIKYCNHALAPIDLSQFLSWQVILSFLPCHQYSFYHITNRTLAMPQPHFCTRLSFFFKLTWKLHFIAHGNSLHGPWQISFFIQCQKFFL